MAHTRGIRFYKDKNANFARICSIFAPYLFNFCPGFLFYLPFVIVVCFFSIGYNKSSAPKGSAACFYITGLVC